MTVRIALAGAGLIGRRHAEAIAVAEGATLSSVTDPGPAGAEVAAKHNVPHFANLSDMLAQEKPDGVLLATPNQMHLDNTRECVEAGLPTLIEKPLASDLESAEAIVALGQAANVPLLTGHHRRHNPLIERAKEVISSGKLGQITAVQGATWFHKPDDYFDVEWRRKKGAGPVYINLIHDIDLMRHLCGEIVSVHALESNAARGNEVEDTAAILLRFENGALGTLSVSDTIVAPWSWELTARENPMYPATDQNCYHIGGTDGSISLPNLSVWSNPGKKSWWEPINATKLIFDFEDPLIRQIRQFAAVIRGEEAPLVTAEEGLKSLKVIEAVKSSTETGQTILLSTA